MKRIIRQVLRSDYGLLFVMILMVHIMLLAGCMIIGHHNNQRVPVDLDSTVSSNSTTLGLPSLIP